MPRARRGVLRYACVFTLLSLPFSHAAEVGWQYTSFGCEGSCGYAKIRYGEPFTEDDEPGNSKDGALSLECGRGIAMLSMPLGEAKPAKRVTAAIKIGTATTNLAGSIEASDTGSKFIAEIPIEGRLIEGTAEIRIRTARSRVNLDGLAPLVPKWRTAC